MQKISYALMHETNGRFLRVYSTENDEDCITPYREFTLDDGDQIYETEEPAAVLDVMVGRQEGRYLSGEARSEWLPRWNAVAMPRGAKIEDYVPVAFVRELRPVMEGGDLLTMSMDVRLARFDDIADPESIWLDDLEINDAGMGGPTSK